MALHINEAELERIVRGVLSELSGASNGRVRGAPGRVVNGQCRSVDEAVEAAAVAFKELSACSLEDRKRFIEAVRQVGLQNKELLARMAHEETHLGRFEHKVAKNETACKLTPGVEILEPQAFTGDHGLTVHEWAPFGVVAAITPITNPSSVTLNNAICMLAAGNTTVVNAHPGAKATTMKTVELVNQAVVAAGGPDNVMTGLLEPSIETANALMAHRKVDLVVATGGVAVVRAALKSGKRVVAAGPGNPPVVVDETADMPKAARCVFEGASFDNNILCVAEKAVVCTEAALRPFLAEMRRLPIYELSARELEALMAQIVLTDGPKPRMNGKFIGRNASVLLESIGIRGREDVYLLICQVPQDHPLLYLEQMMPVLPITTAPDVNAAIDLAVEIEQGFGHSALMHSRDLAALSRMAKLINTTLFVKNGSSLAGLGVGGEGYTAFTIGTTTGEGMTTARTFVRERRCALVDYFRIV
jgi:acyl-CoA reductase-like NAD-dependent aldehyde dehydrogenase